MFNDEMVTESLIQYIQAIQRGRRTGLLVVRRKGGNIEEEGRVRFKQGHVTETRTSFRTGTEAFNELCTWGRCLVSFISSDGQEVSMPLSPPQTPPSPPSPTPQALPSPPSPTPQAGQSSSYPPGSSPLRRKPSAPLGPVNDGKEKTDRRQPAPPTFLQARPSQMRQFNASLQVIETMHLSRAHRQLFLLINGQRTIEELIHLSTRSQEEVLQLLQDLARVAVIRI